MHRPLTHPLENSERGVSFILVALLLVALIAMAALAIDISVLYVAHSEAQRSADAAAIAGAKAFVASGVTSDSASGPLQTVAVSLAQQQINAAIQQNNIAGSPGQLASTPSFTWTDGNPVVSVTVQQAGIPTFFARLWSRAANSVSATAIAEAYNPSGTSASPPTTAHCVKPFIVPNRDPQHTNTTFIDPTTGAITNPGPYYPSSTGIVGETLTFAADCPADLPGGSCPSDNPPTTIGTTTIQFVPQYLPASTPMPCPACRGTGTGSSGLFQNNIACCNTTAMACNSSTQMLNSSNPQWRVDLTVDPTTGAGPLMPGLQCLIHQSPSSGQDTLDPTIQPFQIKAGASDPRLNSSIASGNVITTSDSIITIPIYDGATIPITGSTAAVNVLGFMQVFVIAEGGGNGTFTGIVLNVSGCGNTTGIGNPISGGDISAVPVRLIHR